MARSSNSDPIEKFRFLVTIFRPNQTFLGSNGSGSIGSNFVSSPAIRSSLVNPNFGTALARAGFESVTNPEAKVNTIRYRENIDTLGGRKLAGLVDYTPVTMRRGVTSDTGLFQLFMDTNNEASALNIVSSAMAGPFGALPFQNTRYRKDILISAVDRTGAFTKYWYLSNAFVTGYKGGNDFDATSDEKLIEEITFDYEFFIEVQGTDINEALNNVSALAAQAAAQQAAAKLESAAAGALASALPF